VVHNGDVESAAISKEIEQLEGELAGLRARVDDDHSSFSSLEQQIAALKDRLTETQDAVFRREAQLASKRDELAEAQRLERLAAYDDDLAAYRDARDSVGKAADRFLAELEAYDGEVVRLRKLRDEMRDAFGDDERVAEVEAALDEESNELATAWKAVVGAAEWRIREAAKATGEAPKPKPNGNARAAAAADDEAESPAEEGRAARILEYFSKT
jgi:predicted  nucleic acid-binding Zn-ribbon protein